MNTVPKRVQRKDGVFTTVHTNPNKEHGSKRVASVAPIFARSVAAPSPLFLPPGDWSDKTDDQRTQLALANEVNMGMADLSEASAETLASHIAGTLFRKGWRKDGSGVGFETNEQYDEAVAHASAAFAEDGLTGDPKLNKILNYTAENIINVGWVPGRAEERPMSFDDIGWISKAIKF